MGFPEEQDVIQIAVDDSEAARDRHGATVAGHMLLNGADPSRSYTQGNCLDFPKLLCPSSAR